MDSEKERHTAHGTDNKEVIAVFGATGQQGGAVVRALRAGNQFKVRALTRNPAKHHDDEVVEADLNRPETLASAFRGAYGVFLITNFQEHGADELKQATAAVHAGMPVSSTSCGPRCRTLKLSAEAHFTFPISPASPKLIES